MPAPRRGHSPGRSEEQVPPAQAETSGSGDGSNADLDQAITVLSARLNEEFRISERLDEKQRQAFALASVFFAVVQTVAFGSFAQGHLHGIQRGVIGGLAAAACVILVVVMRSLTSAEKLRDEDDINPKAIVDWCNEADAPDYVAVRLVGELSDVAQRRTASNKARALGYEKVSAAARWSLIASGVELLVAIALRI